MGYPERRREVLEQAMQGEVFRVATAVLAQEGMEALTMDRIAREIGVSRGTLYNYFSDASAVVAFVEARLFEPVHHRVVALASSDMEPEEKLRGVLLVLLDALYECRALTLAVYARPERKGPRADQAASRRRDLLALFRGVLAKGAARGAFRADVVDIGAEILLSTFSGIALTSLFSGEFQPAERTIPRLMDVLLLGLTPGAGSDREIGRPVNPNP